MFRLDNYLRKVRPTLMLAASIVGLLFAAVFLTVRLVRLTRVVSP